MAQNTRIQNQGATMLAQDIFTESSTAQMALGTKITLEDGRRFVYSKAGAVALAAGKLMQAPAEVANHSNCAVAAAAAIGANSVSVTLGATAATANQYAGGFMYVNDAAGEGHLYKINHHAAVGSAGTGTFYLDDSIRVALTTSSEVTFYPHPHSGLIVAPATTLTGSVLGVAPINVTAAYYFWLQVAGPACVLQAGTLVVGANAVTPTGVDGGCGPSAAGTSRDVGSVIQLAADTEYALINLTLG